MSAGVDPVETTARAIWRRDFHDETDWDRITPVRRAKYRQLAEAAIAALQLTEEHCDYSWLPDDPPQYIEDGPDEGALILHRYKVPAVRLVGPWVEAAVEQEKS